MREYGQIKGKGAEREECKKAAKREEKQCPNENKTNCLNYGGRN